MGLSLLRQHVNPLSRFFQLPVDLPSPNDLFADPTKPIHLDIGSARGDFLIGMAEVYDDWNFLGVEIREKLVRSANVEVQSKGLKNIKFSFCNANISLERWLNHLPENLIQRVSIQFPDPWFKRRHYKRRVLQPSLLISLSRYLSYGSEFFIQSDVLEMIDSMNSLIMASSCFDIKTHINDFSINHNPFPVQTNREKYAINKGFTIYRAFYIRNNNIPPKLNQFIHKINENILDNNSN